MGAAAASAQYAPGLSSMETAKPWSFSATVRGFYDNNYLTVPHTYIVAGPTGPETLHSRDSFGVEASPSIAYNHSVEDTLLSASYVYDLKWYEDRNGTVDQTHQFNARMDHEFSERYKMTVNESFVVAQDPGVLDTAVVSQPLRVPGSNMRNTGTLDFTAVMSRLFDVHVGYANTVYAYQQNAGDEAGGPNYPSYSALLDRMDQTAAIDLRYKALPETTGVAGFQYEQVDYTSPEFIIYPGTNPFTGTPVPGTPANSRNSHEYFGYLGADQSFTPNLNASVRVGAEYVEFVNTPGVNEVSPYADASLTWQYMPDSTAQVGVKHLHNSTDVAGFVGSTTPVLDEESTAVYLSVSHRVTSRFTAAAMAQAQYSTFDGGGVGYNNQEENFYVVSINLAYHFTPWLAGETGWAYNKLNSEIPESRSYSRDIVYVGVRGTY